MKNWVVKLLVLLFIPSLAGILFTYSSNEPLAKEAIKILDAIAMVGWTSGGHSAGVVPVYAIGAGSELFNGKLDNIDIPRKIAEAAGY